MKILKFGAVWCSGCLVMRPIWREIERENPWLITESYDYNLAEDLVEKYNISTLPAYIFIDEEERELMRLTGEYSKKELLRYLGEFVV